VSLSAGPGRTLESERLGLRLDVCGVLLRIGTEPITGSVSQLALPKSYRRGEAKRRYGRPQSLGDRRRKPQRMVALLMPFVGFFAGLMVQLIKLNFALCRLHWLNADSGLLGMVGWMGSRRCRQRQFPSDDRVPQLRQPDR